MMLHFELSYLSYTCIWLDLYVYFTFKTPKCLDVILYGEKGQGERREILRNERKIKTTNNSPSRHIEG